MSKPLNTTGIVHAITTLALELAHLQNQPYIDTGQANDSPFATGIVRREYYQNLYRFFPIRAFMVGMILFALILAIRRVATISRIASW